MAGVITIFTSLLGLNRAGNKSLWADRRRCRAGLEWRCRTATGNADRAILSTGSTDADSHAADLFDAYAQALDDRDWTRLASSRPTSVEAAACWVQGKVTDASLVPYAVIEQRSGRAVGLVCFMAIEREHGSVEIGHVTRSPRMKNTVLGTESIWLLLRQRHLRWAIVAWSGNAIL